VWICVTHAPPLRAAGGRQRERGGQSAAQSAAEGDAGCADLFLTEGVAPAAPVLGGAAGALDSARRASGGNAASGQTGKSGLVAASESAGATGGVGRESTGASGLGGGVGRGGGGDGDDPPGRGSSRVRTCGSAAGDWESGDDDTDDLDDVSVGDDEMDDVIADMEMEDAAENHLAAMDDEDHDKDGDEDLLDSVDVDDIAAELATGDAVAATTPHVLNGIDATGVVRMQELSTRTAAPAARMASPSVGASAGTLRFGSAAARATPSFSTARAQTPGRPSDGLDAVLGMREAARVRALLLSDAERLPKLPRRRPLSRGYRQGGEPIEYLTVESAARRSANVIREGMQNRFKGADLEGLVARVGTPQLGALLMHEIETAFRARLATDPDFDATRFPNAASRFGSGR
jgi:hypothetical protein